MARLGPHPHECCCEVCIDRKERQRLYLENIFEGLAMKQSASGNGASQEFTADGPIRIVPPLEDSGFVVRDDFGLLALIRTPGNSPAHFAERSKNLEAFAHLVAAAPELLQIVDELCSYAGGMEYDTYRQFVQRAEAVRAKARLQEEISFQPERCRCGGTIRQQLMGALICGSCGRTP